MTAPHDFDRVLVGFDGKDRSLASVQVALALHKTLGSRIFVMYVSDIRDPFQAPDMQDPVTRLWEEDERAAREQARGRLASVMSDAGVEDVSVDDVLSSYVGAPPQVLVQRAQQELSDLVILGPHTRRGRLDFGSTTRAIMHSATCDVWVQPGPFRPLQRILVPIDLSEHSLCALDAALQLARAFGAEVTLLHAYAPPAFSYSSEAIEADAATYIEVIEADREADREAFQELEEKIDWGDVAHERLWSEGDPEGTILEHSEGHDLIALGTHGRTGLSAALFGNVAYAVLRRAETPVLAVRMPRRRWRLGAG